MIKECQFPVIIGYDPQEDVYLANCSFLQGCHADGKTNEEALKKIKDAVKLCIESRLAVGDPNCHPTIYQCRRLMPGKLPSVKARQATKVLEAIAFQRIRQSGSHATYRHPDGHWTIVSIHRDKTIPKGTLRKIISDAGLTVEESIELL